MSKVVCAHNICMTHAFKHAQVKQTAGAIPRQEKGAKTDISYKVKTIGDKQGVALYEKARNNLLNINSWQQLAGKLSAAFYLTDPAGNNVDRLPLQGDYIKIHLPTSPEDKFDWVRIEAIEEQRNLSDVNWIIIRVRPSDPPNKQETTEHFFSKDATSNFSVERLGRKVEAAVRGRNELPNVENGGLITKIRNILVSIGAMAGMNYPQWKGLVKGIVTK